MDPKDSVIMRLTCTIRVAKTMALISFAVTAKLICAFVFAYADCWFSHEAAHFIVPLVVTYCFMIVAAAPVAEWLRALFLNHSIISPLCLVWVRTPHWPHVRQAKFCFRVCQVVFLGGSPVFTHLLILPSQS